MARLTQWIMALAGLLTSASMSSCSRGNENEEPRPPVDTEQRVATPEKDGGVDRLTPADDASADEKPLIASQNWYEFNVSDNRLSIPPKWYELYDVDVDIEDYKDAVSDDDFDKRYVPSRASLAKPIASSSKATNRKDVSRVTSLAYGPPPAPPRLIVSVTEVTDGFDKRIVQKVVRSRFEEILACYEKECERDKNVGSGEITVSWNIHQESFVSGVIIEKTTLHNKRVEDCLVEAIQRWQFPNPQAVNFTRVKTVFVFNARKR